MTTTQAHELYDLRTTRAWSWYELATRYGISENEVRRIHRAVKSGTFTGTENDATHDEADAFDKVAAIDEWMSAATTSGEQLDLEMWLNFTYAVA